MPIPAIELHARPASNRGRCFVIATALAVALNLTMLRPADAADWGPYRGMTTHSSITEADIEAFRQLGGNLLRVGFADAPMLTPRPPHALNPEAFARLDRILGWCEQRGIHVIVDPHSFPGTHSPFTTTPADVLWTDAALQQRIVELWAYIAKRYAQRGSVIAAYDLLNEPSVPADAHAAAAEIWNTLQQRIVAAIRAHDLERYVIVEPPTGFDARGNWIDRIAGMALLRPLDDPRVIYSPHMYLPKAFTHQGVFAELPRSGVHYPGIADQLYWDREKLQQVLEPVRRFAERHNAIIYIGEFSAACWTGDDGNRYLGDLIELFESFGWNWSYHAFRESPIWDAEITESTCTEGKRSPNTKRLKLLKAAFARNSRIR